MSLSEFSIGNNPEEFKKFLNQVYGNIQVNVQKKIQVQLKVFDHLSKIMAKVAAYDPCYNFRVQFKGSSYEGLKIGQPDEFDYGLVNDAWTGKIGLVVDDNAPAGRRHFAYVVPIISTCLDKFIIPGTKYLDASKVRGHLRDLVEKAMIELGMKGSVVVKPPWEGGPAVTFEFVSGDPDFRFISIDLAIAINLVHWPPPSVARPRPAGLKQDAKAELVPKVLKENPKPDHWLVSFAQVEKAIIEDIDKDGGCRRKVLQLAKYFKGKSGGWYPLASYHLKIILLHMNDEIRQPKDWAQGMLVPRFTELIERLLKRLRSGVLYNYFTPEENLFAGKKDLSVALHGVESFLKTLRENPQALLR